MPSTSLISHKYASPSLALDRLNIIPFLASEGSLELHAISKLDTQVPVYINGIQDWRSVPLLLIRCYHGYMFYESLNMSIMS